MKKVIVLFILLSLLIPFPSMGKEYNNENVSYTMKSPISISGNDDFESNASSGDGTAENPWIIEGYEINGTDSGYCISIRDTTDYFIIRDCKLYGTDTYNPPYKSASGINLVNVTNGILRNNTIFDNTVEDGIYLYRSHNNRVTENTIYGNEDGVGLIESTHNIIDNNTLTQNTQNNFEAIQSSHNNTIKDNILNMSNRGFWLRESDYTTINNNTIKNNSYGVYLDSSSENLIYGNRFINNSVHVNVGGTSTNNTWNLSYPAGGNYWDTYTGEDLFQGKDQNIVGSDGIGDTPYTINPTDYYPLVLDDGDKDYILETVPSDGETSVYVDKDIKVIFIGTMNTSQNISLTLDDEGANPTFQGWSTTYETNDTATFSHNNLHFKDNINATIHFLGNKSYTWQFTVESFGEYITRIIIPIVISIFLISVLVVTLKIIFNIPKNDKGGNLYN